MPPTPKLIIFVEGGRVQAVASDLEAVYTADVVIVDTDVSDAADAPDEQKPHVSWPWVISLDCLEEHHPEILAAAETEGVTAP